MVVLTIVAQQNAETIYFEEPISKVYFMKLISCSLYNSWDTLKKEGSGSLGDKNKDRALSSLYEIIHIRTAVVDESEE